MNGVLLNLYSVHYYCESSHCYAWCIICIIVYESQTVHKQRGHEHTRRGNWSESSFGSLKEAPLIISRCLGGESTLRPDGRLKRRSAAPRITWMVHLFFRNCGSEYYRRNEVEWTTCFSTWTQYITILYRVIVTHGVYFFHCLWITLMIPFCLKELW